MNSSCCFNDFRFFCSLRIIHNKRFYICFHIVFTGVRNKKHDCKIHHGDVTVVEVEKIPVKTAVSGRTVIEGSVVTFEKKNCKEFDCKNYMLCNPAGIDKKQKYDVKSVGEKIDCKKGYDLKKVELI